MTAAGAPDWNAEVYHRVSEPQLRWGLGVLSELELSGDEVVIDAGCGSGRLTAAVLERVPDGRVIALDASEAMLEQARKELARFDGRVAFVKADLGGLTLDSVADVIFSNATFHWVRDYAALAQGLHGALRSRGRLHAQCGGAGNLAGFLTRALEVAHRPAYRAFFEGFEYPATFATPEATTKHLEAAGFAAVRCWLTPAPTPFATRDAFVEFITHVVLRSLLPRLPDAARAPFVDEVADAGEWSLDYVRLDVRAMRS